MANPALNRVWIAAISEVLYIRSADVTVRTIDATPADDQVSASELAHVAEITQGTQMSSQAEPQPSQAEPASGQSPAAEASTTDARQASAEPANDDAGLKAYAATKLDPIYGAFVRAKAINDVLDEMDADDVPTGVLRFLSVTDESVALRRVWPRGLAIGVRGLLLEVDAATGDILKSEPMKWPAAVTGGQGP